jgi:UDP-glucuronate 4-epimerase
MKTILITGCAGFIGFSLCQLLLGKNLNVIGIDNLNIYYSQRLKKKRLEILKKKKNFVFYKINISNKKKLNLKLKKIRIDIVVHLAAQAGVRYAIKKPEEFIKSNVNGFFNLIEALKKHKIKNFFYASSSSVYGDQKIFPLNENMKTNPTNIYGLTKKFNEELVNIYNKNSTKYIGLRFFTVYGEWGRTDMLILKFLSNVKKKISFSLYNYGNHYRDFTYIEDVVKILEKLLVKKYKKNEILNICSGKPEHIGRLVKYMSKKTGFKKIINTKRNNYEIYKTHGSNTKLKKFINFRKFSNIYEKIDNIILWHKKNSNLI